MHTPGHITQQQQSAFSYSTDSPASNSMPHDNVDYIGYDLSEYPVDDQQQEDIASPEFEDRLFGQQRSGDLPTEHLANGQVQQHGSIPQRATTEEAPAESSGVRSSQQLDTDYRQGALKRLAAKKAALSGFSSLAPSFQSPSRAAGLQHATLRGQPSISHARHQACTSSDIAFLCRETCWNRSPAAAHCC